MEELFRSNDPVLLSFATALLAGEDIEAVVLDVHMSVLDGSIGVLPRRVMCRRDQADEARRILRDNGVDLEPGPG